MHPRSQGDAPGPPPLRTLHPRRRPDGRDTGASAARPGAGADSAAWPVLDIRPAVLTAPTPLERLSAAKMGLVDSIYKLKGGKWPMATYFWQ